MKTSSLYITQDHIFQSRFINRNNTLLQITVNDRASRVEMPMPDNSLGIYRQMPATGK